MATPTVTTTLMTGWATKAAGAPYFLAILIVVSIVVCCLLSDGIRANACRDPRAIVAGHRLRPVAGRHHGWPAGGLAFAPRSRIPSLTRRGLPENWRPQAGAGSARPSS